MAVLTIRKLSEDVHRALRLRAASHGRSTEAEVREILAAAVKPVDRVRLGDALASLGRDVGLSDEEVDRLEQAHDKTPAEPAKLA
ncbi:MULTISPECIES: FitA-like ribbon-helix-helix domain-containing protein [unclassified Wenzhouxiangella]|uniref:FitA-like ribbon-helix-helix domain-containing protein n=1 Tax=unclassified Wenzhouxiangella TaxID=2613841 RepID=UPI000E32B59E|nr:MULTISPECIES: plasmid stabilization protein [unclassified Wenzhouxiangella]RFF27313.1 plasmid stabilization protein [Wenzhouxiangella sp. 15181]RFP68746.1 plasmid stabilization protein [Wenzhouxiangella sp. 15190]